MIFSDKDRRCCSLFASYTRTCCSWPLDTFSLAAAADVDIEVVVVIAAAADDDVAKND